ncbi:acetylornithine transaminase [Paenibacillus urinalis]|uniref:Acetylornithine aminotransferase n=2 Tax=Paenibacillus TaxID=44249 RepID=A0AAX3N6C3_9BACL|nr:MULTISPECIES: acetylornithine transaminase [Paenibacillus]WDH85228.1 acetylornithine transaminase [Paenibacillus urinalis]WDH99862.1 acetylornithine transaminase [Paenibacillus urinalis]WDI04980.1 acetylornithine transaminase [Paenibacillus urinalis]
MTVTNQSQQTQAGAPDTQVTNETGSSLFPTYARYPLSLIKGKGSYLWDDKGNKYLDFVSGLAVTNLGHAPDKIVNKVKEQLDELWHVSNLFTIPGQEQAAKLLTANTCADAVFFCNSGAEANEAAIKLARRYQQKVLGKGKFEIITFKQSFHGRTLATLTATGQDKVKEGFLPLPEGFVHVPLHDIPALEAAITPHTAAIMLELILAEGGIHVVDPEFLRKVKALCEEHGLLLIMDEVQTGMGRTGKLFAHQHYDVEPDIFTSAKGIGSGFPVGAMLGKGYLRDAFTPGSHATTFGGTPLAMAAVNATIETIIEEELPKRAQQMGDYLIESLRKELEGISFVTEVRGRGLIVGIACKGPVGDIITAGQNRGFLFVNAGPEVIRFLPNLYVTTEEIDTAVALIKTLIEEHVAANA